MSTRFFAGQKDYIVQLNLMDDQFINSTNVCRQRHHDERHGVPDVLVDLVRASEPAGVQFEAVLQSRPPAS
jgi:hypothetical protein